MVVTLPERTLGSLKKHRITHFLRIPFATAKSTPQLRQSIDHVARDPITAALPRAAWPAPDELHYALGPLSLLKPERKERAERLLPKLGHGPTCQERKHIIRHGCR